MNSSLKKRVLEWRERIGYKNALKSFEVAGISRSTGQKILAGAYDYEPKQLLLRALNQAIKDK